MNHLLNLIVLVGLMTCLVQAELGRIEVLNSYATLDSTIKGQAYVKVCIQNSTHPNQTPLQIRTECVNCTSPLASPGNQPAWHSLCLSNRSYMFPDNAQIIFEVWEHQDKDKFVGSSSITIKNLLAKNENIQKIGRPLKDNDNKDKGTIYSIIVWTLGPYVARSGGLFNN